MIILSMNLKVSVNKKVFTKNVKISGYQGFDISMPKPTKNHRVYLKSSLKKDPKIDCDDVILQKKTCFQENPSKWAVSKNKFIFRFFCEKMTNFDKIII